MKFSLSDITSSLDLPASTIDRWIRQGRIPLKKKDGFYHCRQSVFEKWAAKHGVNLNFSRIKKDNEILDRPVTLLSSMEAGGVFYSIEGTTVSEVLKNATKLVPGLGDEDRQELYERLLERETLNSTGIGKHVAIPHPRTPMENLNETPVITTCFLKDPVDYNSVDDKPVKVLFIILCPTTQLHLQMLSKLSFCIRDKGFSDMINNSDVVQDEEGFLGKINELEARLEAR